MKNLMWKSVLACLLLFMTGCSSVLTPKVETSAVALKDGNYNLDKDHAALLFKVRHLGLSMFIGRFESFDASLRFDAENPEDSALEATIDMTSLDIANDKFGDTLMGPGWFDAEQFPEAKFVSNSITITGQNTGIMHGMLTLHGVTGPVDIEVTFNGGAQVLLTGKYTVGFEGRGSFSRKAFGVDRFGGFVGDKVVLEIHGEFQRN